MKKILLSTIGLCFLFGSVAYCGDAFQVAKGRSSLTDIVIYESCSVRTKQAALDLAEYLGKITNCKFKVVSGNGKTGIAVGRFDDFPELKFSEKPDANNALKRELYVLRSHKSGIYVIGATDTGVEDAVWDLLYRIGYRQFFAPQKWEYIPNHENLSINIDSVQVPDYYARRIWYGYGTWDENKPAYNDWCKKNRAVSSIILNTGHAYEGIIAKNKVEFDAHPEYLGLINGERKSSKFCISNPGLRKLVVEYAIKTFEQNPELDSISMEPSDGGGWCECEECAKMGSITDRALTLANEVADAVVKKFGKGKYVGMYAYSQHSPPPNIQVHPNVIISIATAFIRGGYTVDQLIDGWYKKGATIGIREYYGVNVWDRDLPGNPKASGVKSLAQSIDSFYKKGARFLSAESSDNWGPNGLGYYVASRVLWDTDEVKKVDELKNDFLEKMFGPAKDNMKEFYELIDKDNKPLLTEDLIGRMYRSLAEAKKKTKDLAIQSRINDLILYTRYVELFKKYSETRGEERQQAFEDVIKFAYRIRNTMMVHSYALYRDLPNRDKGVKVPDEAKWNVPEGKNPWKSSQPFTEEEIQKFLEQGINANKLIDFKPVSFSMKFVPASRLKIPEETSVETPSFGTRGVNRFYIWVDRVPAEIKLRITGGLIYKDRGDIKVFLYPDEQEFSTYVDNASIPPDGNEHEIILKTKYQGLHWIEVSDGSAGTRTSWVDKMPVTIFTAFDKQPHFIGRWSFVFYVPKGTKTIGGFSNGLGDVFNSSGKKVYSLSGGTTYFSIPVESNEDGKIWRIKNATGVCVFMTIPSCFARNSSELLIPVEVIEKDLK
ncbi:MAG TPA: DUF4838 domain-containing protein [Candidatus Ratteibacteria bacterium]|jgi:hypothetical protein|nr:DUF4838 domain-containing protein [bacterium]HRS05468.1 DUF4838 domain-containing protein [Candidatus Ratteibacteria bacterium]